jgi:phosphate uptake regulator
MSISSTGIYGVNSTIVTSDLYEDVEQLKTNLTTLTTSHLSVATNHDGRLDTLESDNTSNITRIGDLEIDVSSNITRISDLEIDVSSNITRIGDLEIDVSSNITRIGDLELDMYSNITRIGDLETDVSSNKVRLTDAEDQIFDVVHEPNKHEQEFFYYTPYPVPYDVLEAYSQLIHDKSLTLKDRFDLSANNDINSVVKVVQEILQDHEMKIVAIEFFNSLSEAKAAAQYVWAASKVLANKFGKKIIKKLFPNWSNLLKLDYTELTDITDKTLNEVIDELDNLNTIFKYENGTFNDKGGIKATGTRGKTLNQYIGGN